LIIKLVLCRIDKELKERERERDRESERERKINVA
jgi:hypothetical protein